MDGATLLTRGSILETVFGLISDNGAPVDPNGNVLGVFMDSGSVNPGVSTISAEEWGVSPGMKASGRIKEGDMALLEESNARSAGIGENTSCAIRLLLVYGVIPGVIPGVIIILSPFDFIPGVCLIVEGHPEGAS